MYNIFKESRNVVLNSINTKMKSDSIPISSMLEKLKINTSSNLDFYHAYVNFSAVLS